MCSDIKCFRGVFMRDTLPDMINNRECGVVNIDRSDNNGTHWVAYFKNGKTRVYFDSFGLTPPSTIEAYLGKPLLRSTFQLQQPNDVICGHLCVEVLHQLDTGNDFKETILRMI